MSDSVIALNQSIKTYKKTLSVGGSMTNVSLPVVASANDNEYLEIVFIAGTIASGSIGFQIYTPDLATVLWSSGTAAGSNSYNQIAENMLPFESFPNGAASQLHPRKLIVPNGCQIRLYGGSASPQTYTFSILAVGFQTSP